MELLKNLQLVEVVYENEKTKAVMTFLDEERGEVRDVQFNRKVYDDATKNFVDNEEKAKQVDKWCKDYFGLPFDKLQKAVDEERRMDVYAYPKFNSLWEVDFVEKFDADMVGQIFETTIKDIVDDGKAIHIKFEYEDKTYESKMTYADYLENKKQWFINPQKKVKQYDKFETKFHVPVSEAKTLIGKKIMVEVKKAFGTHVYNEIKPFPKKKA